MLRKGGDTAFGGGRRGRTAAGLVLGGTREHHVVAGGDQGFLKGARVELGPAVIVALHDADALHGEGLQNGESGNGLHACSERVLLLLGASW